ncbi:MULTISPECIES: site-specific DNA-methyltransferase [Bacillales]|uniref:site-specific DNA-methyltransferase n=1 Tax=Bacillales TaxID=1385 RepID=UPI00129515B6|nr:MULTISPECIES: site-specific DNA-methyltransferase [Bacillales]MEB7759008.1 site-specific DNA-methyltransferase [Staphylococcus equorum]MEB7761591.1 site-specific DNA-methyltransferase [Staphylococcus equorum]UTT56184.1 site-specific DNA-methyltransferase [Staphylococcus equorum]
MIKETLDNNEQGKLNDKKISILRENFPNCFSGDTLDIEKFKREINQDIDFSTEGYEMNFLGKNYAKYIADSIDTETVLVPNVEHNSKLENDKSDNVYITGDNLDALKHLRKSYSSKIKMLYIDPPYNTGSGDFVYNDSFKFSINDLMKLLDIEEEEAKRILNMTSSNSSSHSAWLTFMYSRLLLGRELLRDDGVIFISIDDNEQAQLKMLCDDIYGEENFIAMNIHKNNSNKNQTHLIGVSTEYVFCYVKNLSALENIKWRVQKKGTRDVHSLFTRLKNDGYSNEDILEEVKEMYKRPKYSHLSRWNKVDDKGVFKDSDLSRAGGPTDYTIINPETGEECVVPNRGWGKSKDDLLRFQQEDMIYYGDPSTPPGLKDYINSDSPTVVDNFWYYDNSTDTRLINNLFGGAVFENPKPLNMIQQMIEFTTQKDDIVLDFFGGSSTTAQAVMQLNAEKKRNLKFIIVQLNEPVKKDSEAEKLGFKTIDKIGRERIIRAAQMIEEKTNADIDYGFKHYYAKALNESIIDQIKEFDPNLLASELEVEFDKETILVTWMNQDGHGLTRSLEEVNLGGYIGYYMEDYLYLLDKGLTQQNVDTLLSKIIEDKNFNPTNVVIYGYNFTDFNILTQLETNLKQLRNEEKSIEVSLIKRY